MIGVSAGTAVVLGLQKTRCDVLPETAYFMIGKKCQGHCRFCAQAAEHATSPLFLSRVSWPLFDEEEVLQRLPEAINRGDFTRVCMQMVNSGECLNQVASLLGKIRRVSFIPVSLSSNALGLSSIDSLFDAGLTVLSIPLDCVKEELFHAVKGGDFCSRLELLKNAVRLHPGAIATHLIAGLGESEEEMVAMMEMLDDYGITVGLFAFTPLPGTAMAHLPPPLLESYRRLQLAHFLIKEKMKGTFDYTSGTIIFHGHAVDTIPEGSRGAPFMTSGCSGCNRPYYNERPGRIPYNYPRKLSHGEIVEAYRLALGLQIVSQHTLTGRIAQTYEKNRSYHIF
jgi:lipoyl synthase